MSRIHYIFIGLILTEILLLFIGCHGPSKNPLLPDDQFGIEASGDTTGLTGVNASEVVASYPSLWGYYEVAYDSSAGEFTSVPVRGPSYAFNVVTFLQPPSGSTDNMAIEILDDSTFSVDGRMDVRVVLHHPFPGQTQYNGFDVMGVFITEATYTAPFDTTLSYANPTWDPSLENADGYTRWMNPEEFLTGDIFGYEPGIWGTSESSENSGFLAGATLNPYKYFAHTLGPDDELEEWFEESGYHYRGMFPAGASASRNYSLRFPIIGNEHVFIFNYAVVANWAAPTIDPPIDPITDFPVSANALYPLPLMVEDHSQVYYTPGDAGGFVDFEIAVLDWNAMSNSDVQNDITKFIVWSDDPMFPGGSAEVLSEEADWNSGFLAGISLANFRINDLEPVDDGPSNVWIGIESGLVNYDQGFGAEVPDGPVTSYIKVPITIADCPKAFMDSLSKNGTNKDSFIDNIIINGENFVDGADLEFWLEELTAGGSAGPAPEPFKVYATDIKYIDKNTISADFDFTLAPYGEYGIGCVNGCNSITEPDENKLEKTNFKFQVQPDVPEGFYIATGREGANPGALDKLIVNWSPVNDAVKYTVYASIQDIHGNLIYYGLAGITTSTTFTLNFEDYLFKSGLIKVWVKSVVITGVKEIDSNATELGYCFIQNFDDAMGSWVVVNENADELSFSRSTVNSGYSGLWGLKALGPNINGSNWTILASPIIDGLGELTTAKFEFVHRNRDVNSYHGFQVGSLLDLPTTGTSFIYNYTPRTAVSYGWQYNDGTSTALQENFLLTDANDENFREGSSNYMGWYMSGYDVSSLLSNSSTKDRVAIVYAMNKVDTAYELHIDDIALLLY